MELLALPGLRLIAPGTPQVGKPADKGTEFFLSSMTSSRYLETMDDPLLLEGRYFPADFEVFFESLHSQNQQHLETIQMVFNFFLSEPASIKFYPLFLALKLPNKADIRACIHRL